MKLNKRKRMIAVIMTAIFIFNVLSGYPTLIFQKLPNKVYAQTAKEKSAVMIIGDSRVANMHVHLSQNGYVDKLNGSKVTSNGGGWSWFTYGDDEVILVFQGGASSFSEIKSFANDAISTLSNADSVGAVNVKSNIAAYNMLGLGKVTANTSSYANSAKGIVNDFASWANSKSNVKTVVQCTVGKTGSAEARTNEMVSKFNTELKSACNSRGVSVWDLYGKFTPTFNEDPNGTHWDYAYDNKTIAGIVTNAVSVQKYYDKVSDDTDEPEEPVDPVDPVEPDNPSGGGSSGGSTTVNFDLDKVIELIEQSNYLQEANNTLTGYIHNSVDGTNKYLASIDGTTKQTNIILNDIRGLMGTKGQAALTEVYSVNNKIDRCYYKPKLEEVYMLEEFVLAQGFASAYTGFFDLDGAAPYTANKESRALEILGYDFLLSNETYDGTSYNATLVEGGISKRTAVMDVYKALGIEIQKVQLYYNSTSKEDLINSPAIKDLSWIVNDIDSTRGKTSAFITRTNPELYAEKAKTDLHMNDNAVSATKTITLGEFIVLVSAMMDFYGEPVISATEMNALLQVFGGNIPTSLTGAQKNAYIYLRSRGILTDDIKGYERALTFDQMTTILMRVKDKDSRENLKEIQVTMDISDKLKSAGYFPKTISLVSGDDAVQVKKSYYYDDVTYYDYLIDRSSTGFTGDNVFIPVDVQNWAVSAGLNGATYVGVKTVNGKQYYHFRIYATAKNTTYFDTTQTFTGTTETFMVAEAKSDHFVAIKQGGGIYTVGNAKSGVYTTTRQSFGSSMPEFVDAEKKGITIAAEPTVWDNLLAKVSDIFSPVTVQAANEAPTIDDYSDSDNTGLKVQLVVYNASKVAGFNSVGYVQNLYADCWALADQDPINDTRTLVIDESHVDAFLASIIRSDEDKASNPAVQAIASVSGDGALISLQTLIDKGLVYETNSGVWDLSGDVLTIDTKYGRVVLNQTAHMVVTGTTVYRVPTDQTLFTMGIDGDVLVDFRAAYGWSSNELNMTISGTGGEYTVNVTEVTESAGTAMFKAVSERQIKLAPNFNNEDSPSNIGLFIQAGVVTSSEEMLMLSNYPLSNWIVYSSQDANYLYVFYHRLAFESYGITPPTDMDDMKSTCYPYNSIDGDNWVVRKFELSYSSNGIPGQMTYNPKYGFLYNVPTFNEFTYEKYLSGEIMLPIYTYLTNSTGARYNANVNIWPGYKYGTRPITASTTDESGQPLARDKVKIIDHSGNIEIINKPAVNVYAIKATPAGVQALFGGTEIRSASKGSDYYSLVNDAKSGSSASNLACYYGTSKITTNPSRGGVASTITINPGTDTEWSKMFNLRQNNVLYEMARWKVSKDSNEVCRRYICFDDIMVKDTITQEEIEALEETREPIVIEDTETENDYGDFDKFSIEWILDKIDAGTSWVLVITVKIMPMLMIIALTIIVGLSLMSDNKIVQKIVAKTFDPVKILTMGRKSFDQLNKRNSMIMLMIGYFAFILIADGNILRIIVLISKFIDVIARGMRNM